MCMRILLALTACALVFSGGVAIADGDNGNGNGGNGGNGNGDDVLSAERTCQFEVQVPVILQVGECIPNEDGATLDVRTNSAVLVSIEDSDFRRTERDCDGNLLDTVDILEGGVEASFLEVVHCEDGGAALQVRDNGDGTFCVAPHRGGFLIQLEAAPEASDDICNDAGCYVANVTITITAEPADDCEDRDDDDDDDDDDLLD